MTEEMPSVSGRRVAPGSWTRRHERNPCAQTAWMSAHGMLDLAANPPPRALAGHALSRRVPTSARCSAPPTRRSPREVVSWAGPIPRLRSVVPLGAGRAQPDFDLANDRAASTAARLQLRGLQRVTAGGRWPPPPPLAQLNSGLRPGPASSVGADADEPGTHASDGPANSPPAVPESLPAAAGQMYFQAAGVPAIFSCGDVNGRPPGSGGPAGWWKDPDQQPAYLLDLALGVEQLAEFERRERRRPAPASQPASGQLADASSVQAVRALMRAPWRTHGEGLAMASLEGLALPATLEEVLGRKEAAARTPVQADLAGLIAEARDRRSRSTPSPRSAGAQTFHILSHLYP